MRKTLSLCDFILIVIIIYGSQTNDIVAGKISNHTVTEVLAELAAATHVVEGSGQKPLYDRDLEISVHILDMIRQYNNKNKSLTVNEKNRQNFILVASNLLDPVNMDTWRGLGKVNISQVTIEVSFTVFESAEFSSEIYCSRGYCF